MKKIITLLIAATAVLGLCACNSGEGEHTTHTWENGECTVCHEKHTGHTDTDKDGKCDTCGAAVEAEKEPGTTTHTHTYDDPYKYDDDAHWLEPTCDDTTKVKNMGAHTFEGANCTVCDYKLPDTEGLVFALNEDGQSYKVTGFGSVTDKTIVIPATYNGKPVTVIGDKAFWNNTTAVTIIMQKGIEIIGDTAFGDCINVSTLYIPEGVKEIGYTAFMDMTSLTVLNLPGSLQKLGGSVVFYSKVNTINFNGTKAQWEAIEKDGWNNRARASVVNCTDGTVPTN